MELVTVIPRQRLESLDLLAVSVASTKSKTLPHPPSPPSHHVLSNPLNQTTGSHPSSPATNPGASSAMAGPAPEAAIPS